MPTWSARALMRFQLIFWLPDLPHVSLCSLLGSRHVVQCPVGTGERLVRNDIDKSPFSGIVTIGSGTRPGPALVVRGIGGSCISLAVI